MTSMVTTLKEGLMNVICRHFCQPIISSTFTLLISGWLGLKSCRFVCVIGSQVIAVNKYLFLITSLWRKLKKKINEWSVEFLRNHSNFGASWRVVCKFGCFYLRFVFCFLFFKNGFQLSDPSDLLSFWPLPVLIQGLAQPPLLLQITDTSCNKILFILSKWKLIFVDGLSGFYGCLY